MSLDYELYDRQIRTFGEEATLKIKSGSVTIIGLEKGLGTEIAKNLALCGIKNLHFYDDLFITNEDINTGYYYSPKKINYMRSYILMNNILQLNSQINIVCHSYDRLKESDVIICVNQTEDRIVRYNNLCRKYNIKFISLKSSNNKGILFVDAGENYKVANITGENYEPVQVLSCNKEFIFITNGHEFQTGDTIKFSNLQGNNVDILNNEFVITTDDTKTFKLNNDLIFPDDFNFINGTITYVDKHVIINHQDYVTQIINPTMNFLSDESLIKNYIHSDIEIVSVNSIMGSLAASEAIKLISGKYQPITQWFTWHDPDLNYELVKEKLTNSEFFIIGSGAIGCELLKNLAFLNVKKIIITDPDVIEKSNLSRQFLFRESDVGKLKSEVASNAIKNMKPELEIYPLAEKVGSNNINVTDKILKIDSLTGVFNALDNIDARRFMDNECFNYNIPLFESGTMGVKGNTQPIIPFITETYSNSNDPPIEKSFAVCTIKNFPNEIYHTIHWALDQFEFFNRAATNINIWLKNKNMIFEETTEGIQLNKDVWLFTTKYQNNFESYVQWAIDIFYEYFTNQIIQLLNSFPPHLLTSEGNLFWSAGKRCPNPIILDVNNDLHIDFIIATVAILCNITNVQYNFDINVIINIINEYKGEKIEFNNAELSRINKESGIDYCVPQIFDKDNDNNYHIMWINAASNIRALNYSIDPVDIYTTKGIAGKIIPAIATTTSIVAGLITIEMMKYLNSNEISTFKSTFVNLALNAFISAEPIKAKTLKIAGQHFNSWTKFIEKEDLTLEKFLDKYNELFKITITIVALENSLIFADFMDNNINAKLSELIEENYGNNKKEKYILTISCDDDVELPDIILTI